MQLPGLFDSLKDSSIFGVFVYQEEGKIVFANKRFTEILGYSSVDEILDKNILDFIPKDLSNLEEIKDNIRRRTEGEVFPVELKNHLFLSKNKACILVSVFAYTILNESEGANGFSETDLNLIIDSYLEQHIKAVNW